MTLCLNQSFPIGDNPFRTFCPAPNVVQLAIHCLPTLFLPSNPSLLCESHSISISNATEVTAFSARFLQPDPAKRAATTSVVMTVVPHNIAKMGSSIRLFSQPRRVELANTVMRFFQFLRCWKYGHATNVCKTEHPTCPLCTNFHARSPHRCSNPTCPKGGNVKAVPACCPTSPVYCLNCEGPYTATESTCPSCPHSSSPRNPRLCPLMSGWMSLVVKAPPPPG